MNVIMNRLKKALFSKKVAEALFVLLQLWFFYVGFYSLKEYSAYIFGGVNAIAAIVILFMINRNIDSGIKISWAFVIAAVPVFGITLYYFVQMDFASGKIKNKA